MAEAMMDGSARRWGASGVLTGRRAFRGGRAANAPLAGLAGSDLAIRFRHWHGASGQRYLFSIYPLRRETAAEPCPRYENALALAVARDADGRRRILWAGETGPLPDLVFDGEGLRRAIMAGANEIHLHLLAKDQASRQAILSDIAG